MHKSVKKLIIVEIIVAGLILSILGIIEVNDKNNSEGLLSARIYEGILKEESKLIFNFEPLENAIEKYIKAKKGIIAVYILNARDGSILSINNDITFEPASFSKLPIAIITLNKLENGDITLDKKLELKEEDKDPTSGNLYKTDKKEITVEELIKEMLVNSDNTAARVLNKQITKEEWNRLSYYLDYYQHDPISKYYSINAESNVRLFSSLYLSTLLKKENSEKILSYLVDSTFDIHKISGIPQDIRIAHKFANYYKDDEKYFHECGIMYIEDSRIIYCIMTKDIKGVEAEQTIGTILHSIYEFVIKSKKDMRENNGL